MVRGAVWMILFKWVERGLGLLSTLILVRLLSPADFGMVSMALSFIFMAELLSAFSFDVALIQNQSATDEHFHSAWTANILLGGSISLLMICIAVPISHFYKQPAVMPVICALALSPLVGALENIGIVAFRKNLDFRKEFIFQVSRKIIGFCVTIPLAFTLRSYWALVAGMLASRLAATALSYWVQPFRPRFSLRELRSLMRFSSWLLLNNFVNFLKERSSDFVLGRIFGPATLGIYNVSNEFASLPTNEMGAPINRALLPGFAKMAGDRAGIAATFANAIGLLALIAIPAGAGIFAVSHYLVPVVLGAKWVGGVPVMEVLSLNSAILVFHGTIVTALVANGRPFVATSTNFLFVVVMLLGMVTLPNRFGPLGAALAVMLACIVSTPVYLLQLRKYAGVGLMNFFRPVLRPVVASAGMILAVRLALPTYASGMSTSRAGILLAAGVALGGAVYALFLMGLWFLMGKPEGAESQVLLRVSSRLPAWVPGKLRPGIPPGGKESEL